MLLIEGTDAAQIRSGLSLGLRVALVSVVACSNIEEGGTGVDGFRKPVGGLNGQASTGVERMRNFGCVVVGATGIGDLAIVEVARVRTALVDRGRGLRDPRHGYRAVVVLHVQELPSAAADVGHLQFAQRLRDRKLPREGVLVRVRRLEISRVMKDNGTRARFESNSF